MNDATVIAGEYRVETYYNDILQVTSDVRHKTMESAMTELQSVVNDHMNDWGFTIYNNGKRAGNGVQLVHESQAKEMYPTIVEITICVK